jgi:Hypervirulence associated proteins TUDOR domain
MSELHKGDRVEWNTSQGKTEGTIEKKLTEPMQIKKHHVEASEDNPQYLVKSEKTGKEAAHKPESLHRVEE